MLALRVSRRDANAGSNVRGLQTTAEFDPDGANGDGEWVLNTPTLQSIKWWSTGTFAGVLFESFLSVFNLLFLLLYAEGA